MTESNLAEPVVENPASLPRTQAPPERAIMVALVGLLAAGVIYMVSDTVADPDLWGHVRFGQDILRTGSIEQVDPYSYLSAGRRWINHEWLAEVLFAMAHDAAGVTGLVLLKTLICLTTLALVWYHCIRRGLGLVVAGLTTIVTTLLAMTGMLTSRPHIFTFLGFALVVILLHRASCGRPRGLIVLPILFAIWTNLHGGFLAGLAVLLAWTFLRIVLDRPPIREIGFLIVVLIASFLAVLVNPYGASLPVFLLKTATVARPEIGEWQPVQFKAVEGILMIAVMIWTVVIVAVSRRKRDFALLLLMAMLCVGPFVASRHIPLAILAIAVLSADYAADFRGRFTTRIQESPAHLAWRVAALIAAMGLGLLALATPHFARIRMSKPAIPVPSNAVATLKASGFQGNLAVPFNWGEFVIWHLGPGVKVSVDGRRETVYPDKEYAENIQFTEGGAHWDDIINRPETNLVLTDKTFACDRLMSTRRDWVVVYEDTLCRILARAGSKEAESIPKARVETLPPGDSFPG